MVTIGVYQQSSNSALYDHICLENIKKLYKSSGRCNNQQQYEDIIEAVMVYTPEGLADNSPMSLITSISVNNPSSMKSLRQFSEVLYDKHKTTVRKLGAVK